MAIGLDRDALACTLNGVTEDPMPRVIQPMMAQITRDLPIGEGWAYEFKWDGYRIIAHLDRGRMRLQTRREQDYTERVPELGPLARVLRDRRLILDGELVALVDGGQLSFQALQARIAPQFGRQPANAEAPPSALAYLIFDLLYLDGRLLLPLPYVERRELLEGLELAGPSWWVPPYQVGVGEEILDPGHGLAGEGVVAKRLDSPYRPGARTREWLKVKVTVRQEFVVGGWQPSDVNPDRVGSLLLGYYDGEPRRLHYAGKVGTGFTQRDRDQLRELLRPLEIPRSPFDVGETPPGARFARPELVAEVAFREWTLGDEIRHASFQGLRSDKAPTDVVREITT
jgi:bifunctional non-homologous end joining protein LigD